MATRYLVSSARDPVESAAVTVLLDVDWGTATGTSDAALRDTNSSYPFGSKDIGTSNNLEVITATGLGFPAGMTNVLRCDEFSPYGWLFPTPWELPAVGESLFTRTYMRISFTEAMDDWADYHPIQNSLSTGESPLVIKFNLTDISVGGTYIPRIYVVLGNPVWPDTKWDLDGTLDQDGVYRWEMQWKYLGVDTWEPHCRIYNASNTLLFPDALGDTDFKNLNGSSSFEDNVSLTMDDTYMDQLAWGTNAPAGWNSRGYSGNLNYWGGAKVQTGDWCGPY